MDNLRSELFQLVVELAKLEEREKIVKSFIKGLNSIYRNFSFKWIVSKEEESILSISVSSDSKEYGYIIVEKKFRDNPELYSSLVDAVRLVSIIIERIEESESKDIDEKYSVPIKNDSTTQQVASFIGITGRRNIEKYNTLANAILESSPDVIIFALDSDYRYLNFNRKHKITMQNIWGKEIIPGMNMLDIIGMDSDRNKAKVNFDRALSGESFSLVEEYGDESLNRLYWENFYSPIYSSKGEIIGMTCYVLNISERRRAEEALRETKEYLESLINYANAPIVVWNNEYKITRFNKAFERI